MSNQTTYLDKVAARVTTFLVRVGLTDLICSAFDDVIEVYYSQDNKNYLLADCDGHRWTFYFAASYLVRGHPKNNGTFTTAEFQEIIKRELASIRMELPKSAAKEAASFFMIQLHRRDSLPLGAWIPYMEHGLSWQRMLLFEETQVSPDRIEEAKLLPEAWVRKIFTPDDQSGAVNIDIR